ncbi:autoinducer binding domain-containing protein [Bradyrhizobium manausense]|uniref:autoinducer binding domain-containing protein n=1 Tax=Bradyrhizobium manausense TaxID=989370 RepID=UPI001BA8D56E|nr:autoinducer binding domain-containing protein [Bradyrhizobium manausense]
MQTARDDREFERIASRTAHALGFRWFAYLQMAEGPPQLISSYPTSWTSRYFRFVRYHIEGSSNGPRRTGRRSTSDAD